MTDKAPYRTVVCARANHPQGYGSTSDGTAHGYVLLVVEEVPADGLPLLYSRLCSPVTEEWGEWWATWYGGRFEPVLVLDGPLSPEASMVMGAGVVRSIGDNRAVLRLTYASLVPADRPGSGASDA